MIEKTSTCDKILVYDFDCCELLGRKKGRLVDVVSVCGVKTRAPRYYLPLERCDCRGGLMDDGVCCGVKREPPMV